MVPTVTLPNAGLTTSRLALGLSRLHHIHRAGSRQRLLGQALDLGIVHFDAARLYGDGLAEAALGMFLKGRRDQVVVATKFGRIGSPVIEALPWLHTPLRATRMVAKRAGLHRDAEPRWDVTSMKNSVARSLRALATDYIDILFLHEPTMSLAPFAPDLIRETEDMKRAGIVRFVGLSGDWENVISLAGSYPQLGDVLQVAERSWHENGAVPDLTFSVIARGPQSYRTARSTSDEAKQCLKQALARRPNGAVVVSTTNADHLRQLAEIASGVGR